MYLQQNRISLFISLCRAALLCLLVPLWGCVYEHFPEEDMETGMLRFVLSTDVPRDASTRSVDVNAIHDIHLLVYDASHKLLKKVYYPSPLALPVDLTLQVRVGSGYTVYGIANTGDEYLFSDVSAIDTEDKLKAFPTGTLLSWDAIGNGDYLLMSGSVQDVSVLASSVGPSTCSLSLKRLATQVTLHVGIASGSGVMISGYQIYGIPRKSYYLPHPLSTEESETDTQTYRAQDASLPANASDWTDSGLISLSDVTSFNASFYMYENRPGVNGEITAQSNKIKANVPGTEADSAAYVIIYGRAPGYTFLSWKIYLGANNTTNFNIKRNSKYTYIITLKPNEADTRIQYKKLIWAGSNIYWDGTKLTFDVEATGNSDLKQGVAFKWGSLIGVSLDNSYVTYKPLYDPIGQNSSWETTSINYADIPCFTADIADGGQTNTFLNDAAQNTADDYLELKGDICQYLSNTNDVSGSWRMPTAKEFNAGGLADAVSIPWTTTSIPWAKFGDFNGDVGDVNGITLINSCGIYLVNGIITRFPASGYRDPDNSLNSIGKHGYYWSSSAYNVATGEYRLHIYNNGVSPVNYNLQQYAFTVRCVKN